jgi:peptidylprolyl isomerase
MKKIISMRSRVAMAAAATLLISFGLAGCGSSDTPASKPATDTSSTAPTLTGVSATGESGKEPKVTFAKDAKIVDGATAQLIKGTGEALAKGNQVCFQESVYDMSTQKQLQSTWTNNTPDCGMFLDDTIITPAYYNLLVGSPLGSTFGIGSVDTSTSPSPTYVLILTSVSQNTISTKATGEIVSDVPATLPKVTLDDNGAPSIDLKDFKDPNPGKLTVQTLIKGTGPKVSADGGVLAQYTGWLTDGTKFDSSWDRGAAAPFTLSQVVQGWGQGLAGQTVGSQVLLIIPPSLGYGDTANGSIPANSTLIFVVDILATY